MVIVTSHFKGHIAAGFGGAIKQLGMGFAARSGKLEQHTDIAPIIEAEKCIACGVCMDKCNYSAISVADIAVIDDNLDVPDVLPFAQVLQLVIHG